MKKITKVTELDRKFDEGEEDILEHFDLTKISRPGREQKRVNVDCPEWMIHSLDREADRIGITRQSLIKMWLADKLQQIRP